MHNALCDLLGIEVPIFAFSHSPAVVAAVSKAGGMGVLGASRFEPEELDQALKWLTRECQDRPFGVDLVIPATHAGNAEGGLDQADLQKRIPATHRAFVKDLLKRYDVPEFSTELAKSANPNAGQGSSYRVARQLLEISFNYPIRLLVNALGVVPAEIVTQAHERGILVGALVGTVRHALLQKAAGVDLVVAQGFEAGGHTGEIASMVLVPQVVDAVAPLPVLAAGGIASGRQIVAAMALGAQGVWTGSIWLTATEAETHPIIKEKFLKATSSDTLRSRCRTGKPARQLRSAWTDAWEAPGAPEPLPIPLQALLLSEVQPQIEQDAANGGRGGRELINYFVGQVVGMLNEIRPAHEVLNKLIQEYNTAMQELLKQAKPGD
jgi:NAD(P)H-dependent flavin oxidoreductase YrpB (nitropropane dioxygenase family)